MPNPTTMGRALVRNFKSSLARASWAGASASLYLLPKRSFQNLPRLNERHFSRVVIHLDDARGKALLDHPEPVEVLRSLNLADNDISRSPQAWLEAVGLLSTLPLVQAMSPVGSLALVMHLVQVAAANFVEQLATPAFVALVTNLAPLDELVLDSDHQERLSQFSQTAVELACETLPAAGAAFFDQPRKARIATLQGFVGLLIDAACEMGMGIHEDDRDQFILAATGDSAYAGRFDVLADSSNWPAMGRVSFGRPAGLSYTRRDEWDEEASRKAQSFHDFANSQLVMIIDVAAHEIFHACQNSLVDRSRFARGRQFETDAQYHESLATLLSSSVSGFASQIGAVDHTDSVVKTLWLPLEERPAWFLSWVTREGIAKSSFFDPDMRRLARMSHPQEREAVARLLGIRPRGRIAVREGDDADAAPLEDGHGPCVRFRIMTERFSHLNAQEEAALDARADARADSLTNRLPEAGPQRN